MDLKLGVNFGVMSRIEALLLSDRLYLVIPFLLESVGLVVGWTFGTLVFGVGRLADFQIPPNPPFAKVGETEQNGVRVKICGRVVWLQALDCAILIVFNLGP